MAKAPKDDTTTEDLDAKSRAAAIAHGTHPDATAQDDEAEGAATDAPDPSGPAPMPDAAGADNPGPTPEEQHDAIISSATKANPTPEQQQMMAEAQAKAEAEAEAAAAAEAQAKADAQAEADAWDELEKAEAVDVERLQLLIGQIDRLNHTGHRLGLMDELHDVYGMTGIFKEGVGFSLSMDGIDIDPAPDHETALTNWANAARRAIMAAAA